eukprot:11155842-Lingulodinium_polyedra.AAC.1
MRMSGAPWARVCHGGAQLLTTRRPSGRLIPKDPSFDHGPCPRPAVPSPLLFCPVAPRRLAV